MGARSPHDEALLDYPLWYVKLGAYGFCAVETAQGSFLVLFTSPALAQQFIRDEVAGHGECAAPRLYSNTRTQFMARAEAAAADGLCGTLVNLESSGAVGEIIPFDAMAPSSPNTCRRPEGRTVH